MLKLSDVSLMLGHQAVLRNVHFAVQSGEFVAIIGPNGAGKSSLLRVIQQAVNINSGEVLLQQRPISRYTPIELARAVAVVSQNPAPLFALTVQQVATMGLVPHKTWFELNNSQDLRIVSQALYKVGLANKAEQLIDSLSGGELQRLYIARALVQRPTLLLLDEPTNHLDVQYQHQVLQLVKSLDTTAIACLHDLNLAALYCDKILLLNKGEQCAFGTPTQVLQSELLQHVFGLPCQVALHPVLNKLQVTFLPFAGAG